jgi:hypothetical protein
MGHTETVRRAAMRLLKVSQRGLAFCASLIVLADFIDDDFVNNGWGQLPSGIPRTVVDSELNC